MFRYLLPALGLALLLSACQKDKSDTDTTPDSGYSNEDAADAALNDYYDNLAQKTALSSAEERGYDDGYAVGYDEGYYDGLDEGCQALGDTLVRQGTLEWYRC